LKFRSRDGVVAVEENVQIDEARAFGEGFAAAHGGFDGAKFVQQIEGGQIGLRFENGVEKPGLFEEVHGLGFVDAGEFQDADAGFGEKAERFAQIVFAVADVGSERDVSRGHANPSWTFQPWAQSLFDSKAPANHSDHGLRFGQFQGEAHSKENQAVDAKDRNGEKNRSARAKEEEQASSGRSSKQGCDPDLREKRKRHADLPDAAADATLQQSELDPGGHAGRDGQARDAPSWLNAQEARQRISAEVTEDRGKQNTHDGESQRGTRVTQSIKARRIETTESGREQADRGARENRPHIDHIVVPETSGLINGSNDHIPKCEKPHDGGNDEKGDLTQSGIEAGAEDTCHFSSFADSPAHHRQFGRGDGHAEQTYRQGVQRLRVSQTSDRAGQPTGEEGVNVRADLHDAAADEDGKEIADDRAHVFGLMGERDVQSAEKLEDHGELHGHLQCTADDGSPSSDDDEGVLRAAGAKGDHAGDHGDVP